MDKAQVNPWTWQDKRQYSQAWKIVGADSIIFVSGQCPINSDGELVGVGDFEAQTRQTFENLAAVLAASGAGFDDVVKLSVFLTDISKLSEFGRVKSEFIHGKQPASTAMGVAGLAIPEMYVEVEAIAVL